MAVNFQGPKFIKVGSLPRSGILKSKDLDMGFQSEGLDPDPISLSPDPNPSVAETALAMRLS
mgnify:CR=1 FL=1